MRKIIVLLGLMTCGSAYSNTSQNIFWQDSESSGLQQKVSNTDIIDKLQLSGRSLRLDETGLREYLSNSTLSARSIDAKSSSKIIALPLPDGDFVKVRVVDSELLSPEMQEQYPDIKTWRVVGADNPSISGRIDFTPNGFHGMLVLSDGDTVYIDPDEKQSAGLYSSFSKKQNSEHFKTDFNCQVHDDHNQDALAEDIPDLAAKSLAELPNPNLITYRLALAGTAEYTASQGGTSSKAYASMVTTINRVNEIYQRDLGIKLQLVSNESIIYNNSTTDPYTNNSAQSLVSENISNLNAKVGVDNYDVGHVFAQGPLGGLAFAAAACQDNYKAGGATGTPTPNGETFSVEYVAHELGHQLGATHTFNSQLKSCGGNNRTQITAVEPGSGSTIMSYSGLCGTDNVQTVSDAVFHWASINQISEYTRNATGSSCGNRAINENNNLEANAGADYVIPANTPFLLNGSAKGGVTYSWDQVDTGSPSSIDVDLGDNAIIRSLVSTVTESRYIPALDNLFAGNNKVGETLPTTNRKLNFAFVVRDENGSIATDLKKISVINTGETFEVLSQSSPQSLSIGQVIDVQWNVAGTNTAPINCAKVDIQLLSTDGVKFMLLESTENDGSEQATIASLAQALGTSRVMVNCSNNSFFQISAANLTFDGISGLDDSGGKNNASSGGGSFHFLFLLLLTMVGRTRRDLHNWSV